MEEIPPQSRATLSPLFRIVNGTRSRSLSNKELGTFCSRQKHFLEFLNKNKLGNNVALKGFTLTTRNIIMACYAAYLILGETLLCRSIKSGTISRYLSAAADLSVPAKMMNPCLDIMGKQSRYIKDIIKEQKRWEKMPNRQTTIVGYRRTDILQHNLLFILYYIGTYYQ